MSIHLENCSAFSKLELVGFSRDVSKTNKLSYNFTFLYKFERAEKFFANYFFTKYLETSQFYRTPIKIADISTHH